MNIWAHVGEYVNVLLGIGFTFLMLNLTAGFLLALLRGTATAQLWGAFSACVAGLLAPIGVVLIAATTLRNLFF